VRTNSQRSGKKRLVRPRLRRKPMQRRLQQIGRKKPFPKPSRPGKMSLQQVAKSPGMIVLDERLSNVAEKNSSVLRLKRKMYLRRNRRRGLQ